MTALMKRDIIILTVFAVGALWYTCIQSYFPVIGLVSLLLGLVTLPFIYRVVKGIAVWLKQKPGTSLYLRHFTAR